MSKRLKQSEMFSEVDAWRACPRCNSSQVRYRTQSQEYVCIRCGRVWPARKPKPRAKAKAWR